MEIIFEAFGQILCHAAEEVFVFAQAHGGDVGELIVFVNEGCVGEGGVTAAGEDVEEGNGVPRGEPVGDGDGERKGCVVAVRGEDENLQVRLLDNDFIDECPAGRVAYAAGGHFVTCVPCLGESDDWGLALLGFGPLFCGDVVAGLGPVCY